MYRSVYAVLGAVYCTGEDFCIPVSW